MDWLKKLLEGSTLTEEQLGAIENGVKENYKEFLPKHRFDEVNEAKKQLENELHDRNKQLESLKENAAGNDNLKSQIEQIQAENKRQSEEYQAKLRDLTISSAIKLAVASEVHDPELLTSLVDKSKIEVDENGTIKAGLDEQIKSLRDAKGFLFVDKQSNGAAFKGAKPKDGSGAPNDPKPQNLAEAIARHYNQ